MPPPTPRPEPGLTRRTARVLVLPAPTAGGAGDRVRFALRLGADGWVEVAESLLAADPAGGAEPAGGSGAAGEPAGTPAAAQSWPMLLRGLAEAEAVVCAHHARRQRGEPGGSDPPPPPPSPPNRARPESL